MKFDSFVVGQVYVICPTPMKVWGTKEKTGEQVWLNEKEFLQESNKIQEVFDTFDGFEELGEISLKGFFEGMENVLFRFSEPFFVLEYQKNSVINDKVLILQTFNGESNMGYISILENYPHGVIRYKVYGKKL